eukprot:TRINITY_DN9969_c0_g1_i1.p1 TRINITY_DN9969_c0_g1~~TRINITY_DN9969_c0_g1_i1.p1  ORF type:complete len:582 (-),score=83.06 TRINITY_DN9969_c0_g1_i1:170-1915(-)
MQSLQIWQSARSERNTASVEVAARLAERRQRMSSIRSMSSDDSFNVIQTETCNSPKVVQYDFEGCLTSFGENAERNHREICSTLTALGQTINDVDSRVNDILERLNTAQERDCKPEACKSGITLQVRCPKQSGLEDIHGCEIPSFESHSIDASRRKELENDSDDDLPVAQRSQRRHNTGASSNSSHGHGVGVMNQLATQKKRRGASSKSSSGSFGMGLYSMLQARARPEWQKKVWQFLEDPDMVRGGRTFMNVISFWICFGVVLPFSQLMMASSALEPLAVIILEFCLDLTFMLETLARMYVSPNRLRFFFNTYNDIDMLAFCLPFAMHCYQMQVLDSSRHSPGVAIISCWVPVLRLLKLLRRFETFHLLAKALEEAQEALPMLIFTLLLIVLVFASLIFMFEPRENITSMGDSLWFTIVTVGTIGYGDITPESAGGLLTSVALIVVSALYMAIPLGIVGESFSKVWKDRDRLVLVHRARTRFLNIGYKAEDIPSMFCGWDNDGDGEIDLPEFINMMRMMEIDMPGPRLVQLFGTFDKDGSGTIDDQEFVRTLFPDEYAQLYASVEVPNANQKPEVEGILC